MRQLRNVAIAGLVLASITTEVLGQRTVRTSSQQSSARRVQLVTSVGGVALGLDDPRYIQVVLPAGQVGGRMFLQPNMALDLFLNWFSQARKNTVGISSHEVELGFLYGLTALEPGQKGTFIRPSLMISGGSGGTTSRTTISIGAGQFRQMLGIPWEPKVTFHRLLETGSLGAESYITFTFSIPVELRF